MPKTIRAIINDWDPIHLFPHAPSDEYAREISAIETFLHTHPDCAAEALGQKIFDCFLSSFDHDVFTHSRERCQKIAEKILD